MGGWPPGSSRFGRRSRTPSPGVASWVPPARCTYRLEIRGPLPHLAHDELHRRFGEVEVTSDGELTVLSGLTDDQAALRAVLSLRWDLGSEVRLMPAACHHPPANREGEPSNDKSVPH